MNELEKEMITEAFKSADVAIVHDEKSHEAYICLVPGHTLEPSSSVKGIEIFASDITEFVEETGIEMFTKIDDLGLLYGTVCSFSIEMRKEVGNPYTPKQPNAVYIPPHIAKRQKRQKGKGLHF